MKIQVAVIYGGTSSEHEVSVVSANAVISNLDKSKYDVIPIKITKDNLWIESPIKQVGYTKVESQPVVSPVIAIDSLDDVIEDKKIDVVFPVLHGPYGEDGTIQGLLELMRMPYVGCGVTGSAVCMDKVIQKNICESYGIQVAPYTWITKDEYDQAPKNTITKILTSLSNQYPFFVKPANQGSSVGITKAHNEKELIEGIENAFSRDLKVIIEKGIDNVRELEVGLLGTNHNPQASVVGEIISAKEFYDFESKYLNQNSKAIIPAELDLNTTKSIQEIAMHAFTFLDCYGLARIDFLLDDKTKSIYLNEVNTLPGFTPISMYPQLWAKSGLSYAELLDKLIDLALQKHKQKTSLNLSL